MTKEELKAIPFLKAEIASIRGTPQENRIPKLQAELDELESWIDAIPGQAQTIFRMYFIDQKDTYEIADKLGYDRSNISKIIIKQLAHNSP